MDIHIKWANHPLAVLFLLTAFDECDGSINILHLSYVAIDWSIGLVWYWLQLHCSSCAMNSDGGRTATDHLQCACLFPWLVS
jgi:hypothetical protein